MSFTLPSGSSPADRARAAKARDIVATIHTRGGRSPRSALRCVAELYGLAADAWTDCGWNRGHRLATIRLAEAGARLVEGR